MIATDPHFPRFGGKGRARLAGLPGVPLGPPDRPGILVVDDDETVRDVVNAWMRQDGFAVWLVASGREALDLYRRHREDIDVVLLDVQMPGLDGPQTLAAHRDLNPQL